MKMARKLEKSPLVLLIRTRHRVFMKGTQLKRYDGRKAISTVAAAYSVHTGHSPEMKNQCILVR